MADDPVPYDSYVQFVQDTYQMLRGAPDNWRMGQTAFNVLVNVRPDLSEQVRGTDLDPFYKDDRLLAFYQWVEENW